MADAPAAAKPLGQQYHEAVEALKVDGTKNADAIRQVADDFGKQGNAIRGAIHQYKTKLNGGPTATRRTRRAGAHTVDDHLTQARQSLEQALALVDREVADAKADLDAAQAHYDSVAAAVKDRKADIERKLQALA